MKQRRKTLSFIRGSSLSTLMTDMCELLDSGFLDRKSVADEGESAPLSLDEQ